MATPSDYGLLALRLGQGLVFFLHGWPKIKTLKANPSMLIGVLESLAGLAAITGLYTRYAAIVLIVLSLGNIIYKRHTLKASFFTKEKPGWDIDFLLLAMAVALYLLGPGRLSVSW